VTVPDVVDRPQFVTRAGLNQVTINEFARWGEPLKGEIARVIGGRSRSGARRRICFHLSAKRWQQRRCEAATRCAAIRFRAGRVGDR
jgi:hypothetical protein